MEGASKMATYINHGSNDSRTGKRREGQLDLIQSFAMKHGRDALAQRRAQQGFDLRSQKGHLAPRLP